MNIECVNHEQFGCTCRECYPGFQHAFGPATCGCEQFKGIGSAPWWAHYQQQRAAEWQQKQRDEEMRARLQALMQKPSVFDRDTDPIPEETPAAMPSDPWREKVIEQIRRGRDYSTLELTFNEWQDFLGEGFLL